MREMHADILILGGGIGGYETFRELNKLFLKHGIKKQITLVDKNNFFTFTPLLHEVAAGTVGPTHASVPFRELMHKTKHRFIRASVEKIDPTKRQVQTSMGTLSYDTCVVALGSTTNFFGVPGAEEHTFQVRTLKEALALQSAVLDKLEDCSESALAINVVGGGYTGVEVAAEFSQIVRHDIKKLYPKATVEISLVQSGPTILPILPKKVQKKVTERLKKFGINLVLNERAVEATSKTIHLKSGKKLKNDITIWTTGFTTHASKLIDASYVERDRMIVNPFLQSPQHKDLYVVGDMALIRDPYDKEIIYPQLGEAAHREGLYCARNIVAEMQGKKIKPFQFKAKGTLIPVGEWYGVAIVGPFIFFGKLAWWMRRTAYLAFMPGWLRRARIAFDWTLNTFGFRHIIDLDRHTK